MTVQHSPMTSDTEFLTRLLSISHQMAATHDVERLLPYAMRSAMELLHAEYGYLMLVNAAGEREFKVKLSQDGSVPDEALSSTILNQVWHTHEPMVVYDALTDPLLSTAASVKMLGLRSVMCAPLVVQGRLIGAIYLENRSATHVFQQKELEPLMMFVNQAAVSIENALITSRLEVCVSQRTQELESAMQQLERGWLAAVESNRIRTSILAAVAHDIRSPIGLAISALQTMREGSFGELNDRQIVWIDRSLESLNYAITLTGDVFDLSKAELEGLQLNLEAVDMRRFMVHLSQLGEGVEWAAAVTFETLIPRDLPTLMIDSTRIQQVVFNLLANAQRFTREGTVTLYARVEAANLLIGVRDTGDGIPDHQRDRIFERFHQAEQDNSTRFRGTGLGLSICRELVTLHGGNIRVESEMNAFSDFMFTLPLQRVSVD